METRILIVINLLHLVLSASTVFAAPHSITPWHGNQAAAVSLTFDDAFTSQYIFVLPAINQRGFKGTFFILTSNADYFNSWGSWAQAVNMGHEIASHTLTHPYLTALPLSEAEYEIATSQTLINAKIPGQKTLVFAYPYGDLNTEVKALVKKYYIGARGTGETLNDASTDLYNEAAYDVARQTVLQMEDLTVQAVSQKKWLIPCFHGFDPGEYGGWSTEQFLTYMDYLKGRTDLWIAPFGTVFKYVKERGAATLSVATQTSDTITLNLTDTLADAIFDYPLTVRSEVPENWSSVKAQQGATVTTLVPVTEESTRVVYYDAIPDRGNITLTVVPANQAPSASNDSYSTAQSTALTVAAPGVLGNDSDPEGTALTAQLVTGASHGTLVLNSNGSFTYTPVAGYVGSDSFTYRVSDGMLTSNTATVTITIIPPNQAPVASNDSYSTTQSTALTAVTPGVLGNDSDPEGTILTAQLVTGTSHGTLVLNSNGSFTYTPVTGYVGSDSFTYRASDGTLTSGSATVNLTITSTGNVLFADNFTRSISPPVPLSPWTAGMGSWGVTSGVLNGSGTAFNYSHIYYAPAPLWDNYAVEAGFKYASSAFGGGLGCRLNPATGAQYAAWIYPDNSVAGHNVLVLGKMWDWTTYSGTPMAQVNLTSVGTGWHTLKLVCNGNRIQVYYDGTAKIDVTDNNYDSRPPYLSGGIGMAMWTFDTVNTMTVDNVVVSILDP